MKYAYLETNHISDIKHDVVLLPQNLILVFSHKCLLKVTFVFCFQNATCAFPSVNATLVFSHRWLKSILNWEALTLMGSRLFL